MSLDAEHDWFVPGSIRGARFWLVDASGDCDEVTLRSPRIDSLWARDGRPTRAECPLGCATPPGSSCSCGIYAYHPDSRSFRPRLVTGRQVRKDTWTVWGEVEAWGDVEVHEAGFRAEFALPVSLYTPSLLPPRVRRAIMRAADAHGVRLKREWSLRGRRRPRRDRALAGSFRESLLAG